jgi:hypothetical protein
MGEEKTEGKAPLNDSSNEDTTGNRRLARATQRIDITGKLRFARATHYL